VRAFAFDFEGPIITEEVPFPKPVCMSSCVFDTETGETQPAILETADDGIKRLAAELERGSLLVNAYIAFDLLVAWTNYPKLRDQLVHALEEDRVTDVLRRQFLIDCAWDEFRNTYNLATVAAAVDIDIVPDKKNPWRLRYAELEGVPVSSYPVEARDYALDDARAVAEIYLAQELCRDAPLFGGADCLKTEFFTTYKSVALADMSGCGMRTDPDSVAMFRKVLELEAEGLRDILIDAGLVVREVERDQDAVAKAVFEWNPNTPTNKSGRPSLAVKNLDGAPPHIMALKVRGKDEGKAAADQLLIDAGLANVKYKRAAKLAGDLIAEFHPESGGKLDADSCRSAAIALRSTGDSLMDEVATAIEAYSRYQSVIKTLGTDITLAEKARYKPFCARYYPAKNGREITGEGGNLQNMPREPGIRELWVAPDGMVFISADYPALELRTFGTICKNIFGYSQVLDDLNADVDLHLGVACDYLNIHPTEGLAMKKAGDPEISRCRTMGKGLTYGAKGGMGAGSFIGYVWNNYGVDLSNGGRDDPLVVSRKLLDIHDARTPEWRPYKFKYVQSFARPRGDCFDVRLPFSGMLVAGLRYPDACNYPFSHLATIVNGIALIESFKSRWGYSPEGKRDPLYGCRGCVFIHDEIIYSAEESVAAAAAERLA